MSWFAESTLLPYFIKGVKADSPDRYQRRHGVPDRHDDRVVLL